MHHGFCVISTSATRMTGESAEAGGQSNDQAKYVIIVERTSRQIALNEGMITS